MIGNVLITGGSGFFARHFAKRLLDEKLSDRIAVYSRDEFKQFTMRQQFKDDEHLRWFIGDVRDKERLTRALQGIDVVVHAAALKRIEVGQYNPAEMVKTNVIGSMNVVDACQDCGVKTAVLLSSDKAFEPISPYGQSKALAESIFLASNETGGAEGTRFVVTRYGNVAGSTGSVIPIWREAIAYGRPIKIADPTTTRFWMTAAEAVDLVLWAIQFANAHHAPIVPRLSAFDLGSLWKAIAPEHPTERYDLPAWEKHDESLSHYLCSRTARRMSVEELREALIHVK